jgi:acyl-CoA thioesterase
MADTSDRLEREVPREGPRSLDGMSSFLGIRWDDPRTARLQIRPELINAGGLLSGVATYGLVDYCMGSTLWAQTSEQEHIATISISINYVQTATEGEAVCTTTLDRRNRSNAVMRSEVRHEDGRLLATAIGSYAIFSAKRRAERQAAAKAAASAAADAGERPGESARG